MKKKWKTWVICGVLALAVIFCASTPFFAPVKKTEKGLTWTDYRATKNAFDFTYNGHYYQRRTLFLEPEDIKGDYLCSVEANNNSSYIEIGEKIHLDLYTVKGINPDFLVMCGDWMHPESGLKKSSFHSYSNTYKYGADVLETMLNFSANKDSCTVMYKKTEITNTKEFELIYDELKNAEFVITTKNIGFIRWNTVGKELGRFNLYFTDSGYYYSITLYDKGYALFEGVAGMGIKVSDELLKTVAKLQEK